MDIQEAIVVKQLPIIGYEDKLEAIHAEISEQIQAVTVLECTEETVKEIKKVKADLNKQLKAYEEARKGVKKAVIEPYQQFETVYKRCVSDVFKAADEELKAKIATVENALKLEKHEKVSSYAIEKRDSLALTWLNIEEIMPNITLSASEKSLKAAVEARLDAVYADVQAIDDYEVFVEYKKSLNLAQAQTIVRERKAEIERAKAETEQREKIEQAKAEAATRVQEIIPDEEEAVLMPPTQELVEDVYSMTFTVSATLTKLKALKQYMMDNDIEFMNGGY